jgi:hypothetical protein
MRRRRAAKMVEALIMGAAIRPRPVFVKVWLSFRDGPQDQTRKFELWSSFHLELPGSMLRIAPE